MRKRIKRWVLTALGINHIMELLDEQRRVIDNLKDYARHSNGEKIRVIFICNRPQMWLALESVYESMRKDECFDTILLAIPAKERKDGVGFNHDIFESTGAEEYLKSKYGTAVIEGYNYDTHEWIDLFSFCPDYVFYQTSYNVEYPMEYSCRMVSTFAKTCFVPYGAQVLGDNIIDIKYNEDFCNNLDFIFLDSDYTRRQIINHFQSFSRKSRIGIFDVGFPKYDRILFDNKVGRTRDSLFCVLWTPRWCTEDGNCNYFDYKDRLLEYAWRSEGSMELIFRPHPHMWANFLDRGEMTSKEIENYEAQYNRSKHTHIDTGEEYIKSFQESSVLVTDGSSLIAEYFLTGKPIIYCHKEIDGFTEFGKALSEGFYWANNWSELAQLLDQLRCGDDRLKEKRELMISTLFTKAAKPAGEAITEIIKKNYENTRAII